MVSLEYDPSCNALYIRIKKGKVAESEPISDNLIVDIDHEGEVLGIEMLAEKIDLSKIRNLKILGMQDWMQREEKEKVSTMSSIG